jgi:predicted ester cyclase
MLTKKESRRGDVMSLEENKAIVRRFVESYNTGNLDLLDDIVAPDYVDHAHQLNLESLKQIINMALNAFHDYHETIEDIIAEGDQVWVRIKATGTHTGEFMGIAPTGKKIIMMFADMFRIVNGKIVEYWEVRDGLDYNKQLGIIEYTEKGKKLFSQE